MSGRDTGPTTASNLRRRTVSGALIHTRQRPYVVSALESCVMTACTIGSAASDDVTRVAGLTDVPLAPSSLDTQLNTNTVPFASSTPKRNAPDAAAASASPASAGGAGSTSVRTFASPANSCDAPRAVSPPPDAALESASLLRATSAHGHALTNRSLVLPTRAHWRSQHTHEAHTLIINRCRLVRMREFALASCVPVATRLYAISHTRVHTHTRARAPHSESRQLGARATRPELDVARRRCNHLGRCCRRHRCV
jgi:hypothetical protein